MERSGLQRAIPIALIVAVIAVAIAALISLGQTMFGGSDDSRSEQANVGKEALTEVNSNNKVRMSVRGPLVANEDFNSFDITVSPGGRNMTTYVGYVGKQVATKNYGNNRPAYEQFVYALDRAGMMDAMPFTGSANDLRGICATGQVYQFEVLSGSNVIQSLWTTTCDSDRGSLTASRTYLADLFEDQIPDFGDLRGEINL